MLDIKSLFFSYDSIGALWDVSLNVEEKAIVAVLGSNCSGKTTLLCNIAGLYYPQKGQIVFDREDITLTPAYDRVQKGISMVPEGRRLFPYMTVMENLEAGAYLKKAQMDTADNIKWVFELFPILRERRKQLAWSLSGGEQQMLAIARGLMSNPRMLLLDEPSLGLAPTLISKMFDMIQAINDHGVTVLLVEQNVYEALEIADKAYVLENGRIVARGSGRELLGDERIKIAYLGV